MKRHVYKTAASFQRLAQGFGIQMSYSRTGAMYVGH